MANSYTVNGKSKGISIEGAINDALKQVKPSNVADQLVTLKVNEIKINKGGIAGIEETEVKCEITSH
jgi:hypothetical protein